MYKRQSLDTVSQFWTGADWNISLSLQHMPHLFSHIMVRAVQDIPNWIIDESGRLTLKSARTFFWIQGFPVVGVNLFGLHIFCLPKLLSFGKFFMGGFLQISIFKIKVCIFVLCVRFVKNTMNLFNIYFLNVLMLCVFGVGVDTFFLLIISLIKMIFFLLLRVMVAVG